MPHKLVDGYLRGRLNHYFGDKGVSKTTTYKEPWEPNSKTEKESENFGQEIGREERLCLYLALCPQKFVNLKVGIMNQ
jgi:hypothetical protein